MVRGLARIYLCSRDGRQVTVGYAGPATLVGLSALTGAPNDADVAAVSDCMVLRLDVASLLSLGERDVAVAWAMSQELSRRLTAMLDAFAISAFGSVRQRLAHSLLDFVAPQESGDALVVRRSAQELADAVGSVREVIGRTLRELHAAGMIDLGRNRIHLIDPVRLLSTAIGETK